MARYLFDDLGYRRFEWKLDCLNEPSARAARRLGFTYEGRFRNAMVYKGRNRDTDWFAMTDGDWPRIRDAHERWLDPANFDAAGVQRTSLSDLTGGFETVAAQPPSTTEPAARGRVNGMDQRISFVTFAVRDLDATKAFYIDGLGWEAAMDVPGEVLMIKVGEHVAAVAVGGGRVRGRGRADRRGPGLAPFSLAHNVPTREEVDDVLETARRAGADPVSEGVEREWGGYTGYFADPDGFRWEIAWNPGPIGQEVLP